uniref:RNA-directed DNA polymerase n=1 Tax=Strigamia maritima TaxID=126957 RepID=T1IM63_STRMM
MTAVHWALIDKFRIYLLGNTFKLITDNFTTAYVLNKAKLNRKFAHYIVDFAEFDFTPMHRPGKQNVIADHLSRYPLPLDVCLTIFMSGDSCLKEAQRVDGYSSLILEKLKKPANTNHLKQVHESFALVDDILVHVSVVEGRRKERIVVPQSLRSAVLKICHDGSGHFDTVATLSRVRAGYWWKSMLTDVKAYTRSCMVCSKVNRRTTLAYGF